MKTLVTICRIVVGLLFIFSGLVKANDPLGLAYKMEEFFEIWNNGLAGSSFFLKNALTGLFSFLHDHSLFLSVVMIAFEIIAGAALLLGWRMKLFSWLLLLLIVFFTFLTAYAFLAKNADGSPKFTNCGCFGDCLPITPLTSFLKDVALTILIVFLFVKRRWIRPVLSYRANTRIMLLVTIVSFAIQWYTLSYLPVFDCLPYKKGNNIPEQMKKPANAVPDSTVITFVYSKQGRQLEFTSDRFPADFDSTYQFVSRYDKVVRKGKNNVPPISGFILRGATDQDSAGIVLAQPYAILLYCEDFSVPVSKWKDKFAALYTAAREKGIPVYAITRQREQAIAHFAGTPLAGIPVFTSDNTAIRTAARTNPCVYLLKEGTILGKWSHHGLSKATRQVRTLVVPQPVLPPVIPADSIPAPLENNKIK
ncbi:MAG: BT_3928 family protein [Chitinophagaceae bacterium]